MTEILYMVWIKGFPGDSGSEESACNVGDLGSIPGLGRFPGEETGNPLPYSCLKNPMDRGAWWAIAHGVTKSQARLSDSMNKGQPFILLGCVEIRVAWSGLYTGMDSPKSNPRCKIWISSHFVIPSVCPEYLQKKCNKYSRKECQVSTGLLVSFPQPF